MPTERSEKIKQYIVIALVVTAVVVAYFRFFHKAKEPGVDVAVRPQPGAVAGSQKTQEPGPTQPPAVDVAARPRPGTVAGSQKIEGPRPQRPPAVAVPVDEFLSLEVRDIFQPPAPPLEPGAEKQKRAEGKKAAGQKPAPTVALDLQGTITGGKSPLAIINNNFFRVGEKIGSYRIVAIVPNTVYLKAGRHQKVIRVLEEDKK